MFECLLIDRCSYISRISKNNEIHNCTSSDYEKGEIQSGLCNGNLTGLMATSVNNGRIKFMALCEDIYGYYICCVDGFVSFLGLRSRQNIDNWSATYQPEGIWDNERKLWLCFFDKLLMEFFCRIYCFWVTGQNGFFLNPIC